MKGVKLLYSLREAIKQSHCTAACAMELYLNYNPLMLFRNTSIASSAETIIGIAFSL
jgi:hypothetical protein